MRSVGWLQFVCSHDMVYYCCSCGCCDVGSVFLCYRCGCLVVFVGTSGVVVGIVDCLFWVVAMVREGVIVCSMLCVWVSGVGYGIAVVCVG
jgi:uncharacterized protein (DUF779 family)